MKLRGLVKSYWSKSQASALAEQSELSWLKVEASLLINRYFPLDVESWGKAAKQNLRGCLL